MMLTPGAITERMVIKTAVQIQTTASPGLSESGGILERRGEMWWGTKSGTVESPIRARFVPDSFQSLKCDVGCVAL
ncbi:hypothetical protein OO17_13425 [Rhodopseudomonas palustris]|uniref:Uncharacterized protein n=1 Tax=Rhodopseudomonas palustris TaxID=1076 RepID=A0A0D7ENL2_RHOPL|nr:hypothetical protein OO17_13425 [Rhodopseudomonas palustris]